MPNKRPTASFAAILPADDFDVEDAAAVEPAAAEPAAVEPVDDVDDPPEAIAAAEAAEAVIELDAELPLGEVMLFDVELDAVVEFVEFDELTVPPVPAKE